MPILLARLDKLTKDVRAELSSQGFEGNRIHVERTLNMRFEGTDTALMVLPTAQDGEGEDFEKAFKRVYKSEFGFLLDTKSIIVDDIKVFFPSTFWRRGRIILTVFSFFHKQVRGIGKTFDTLGDSVYAEVSQLETQDIEHEAKLETRWSVYFDKIGRVDDTPVFLLDNLDIGDVVIGPAMIIDNTQTIVIVPGAKAVLTSKHLYITLH